MNGLSLKSLATGLCVGVLALSAMADDTIRPIFRSYSPRGSDHLFSTNQNEGPNAGYINEGVKLYIYTSPAPGRVALMRCLYGGGHFLSTSANCENQRVEGPIGFITTADKPGMVALIRFFNAGSTDHVSITEGATESLAGFGREGLQGYVIPPTNQGLNLAIPNGNVTSCDLLTVAIENQGSRGFQGRGDSRAIAIDIAIDECKRNTQPASLCLPELGATLLCN